MKGSTKIVLVLIDGIGDVSVDDLEGLTPLQAAHTPHMDAIAGSVAWGLSRCCLGSNL